MDKIIRHLKKNCKDAEPIQEHSLTEGFNRILDSNQVISL